MNNARTWIIYAALLAFFAIGSLIDVIIFPRYGERYSPNDVIQTIGIWLLLCAFVASDRACLQKSLSKGWRFAIVLLMPLGLAFWLFLSRRWPRALLTLIAMIAGMLAAHVAGWSLGLYLHEAGALAQPRRWLGVG